MKCCWNTRERAPEARSWNREGLLGKWSRELGLGGNVDNDLAWRTGQRRRRAESAEREGQPQRRSPSRRQGSSDKANSNDRPLLSAL